VVFNLDLCPDCSEITPCLNCGITVDNTLAGALIDSVVEDWKWGCYHIVGADYWNKNFS